MSFGQGNLLQMGPVLGIDPGSIRVGLAVWDPQSRTCPHSEVIVLKGKTADDRLCVLEYRLGDAIDQLRDKHGFQVVAVEGMFVHGQKSRTTDRVMAEAAGLARRLAMKRNLTVHSIPPTEARMLVLDKGNIQKDDIPMELNKKFGTDVSDPEEADALVQAIALCRKQQLAEDGIHLSGRRRKKGAA